MSNNYLLRNGIQFNQNYYDEEYENDEYFGQICDDSIASNDNCGKL